MTRLINRSASTVGEYVVRTGGLLRADSRSMMIHHLNCISACPLGGLWLDGYSRGSLRGRLATHCLLVETANSLVLVDTGYGLKDVENPRGRLNPVFLWMMKPELRVEMTAVRQIQRLGFNPRDVRHIVLSHLDFDHAGGLDDFPQAVVHLLSDEVRSATAQSTLLDRMRYRPAQWGTRANWRVYATYSAEMWFNFTAVRALSDADTEVLLIPLLGHTLGHAGVAIRADSGWVLYAGDAYFYHAELRPEAPYCTPGLRMYQSLMEKDRGLRLLNQERLRDLKRSHPDISIFCAHDAIEFEKVTGQSTLEPVASPLAPRTVERVVALRHGAPRLRSA